jgi:hypothetical protein
MKKERIAAIFKHVESYESTKISDEKANVLRPRRVYSQTIYYQENLAFCFQLCTVAQFIGGFLSLPWFLVPWF